MQQDRAVASGVNLRWRLTAVACVAFVCPSTDAWPRSPRNRHMSPQFRQQKPVDPRGSRRPEGFPKFVLHPRLAVDGRGIDMTSALCTGSQAFGCGLPSPKILSRTGPGVGRVSRKLIIVAFLTSPCSTADFGTPTAARVGHVYPNNNWTGAFVRGA